MPRSPKLWLACRLAQRRIDRHGLVSIEARRSAERAAAPASLDRGDGLQVAEHTVAVDGGSVIARVYRPAGDGPLPAHLLAHGGAFCTGGPDQVDALARGYATSAGCLVVSVAYRLAPEHVWPTAVEDYYATLRWVVDNAAALGVDTGRISVGGVSVGAGIAAAVALMARDRGGPPIVFQLLEIPEVDLTMSQPSMTRYATGYLVTRAELERGVIHYCPDETRRAHPYASPLLADDLTNLPPALVLTCQYDPLRDEGERYAHRLHEAGVPARLVRARGHVHSSIYSDMRSARRYREVMAAALREALRTSS